MSKIRQKNIPEKAMVRGEPGPECFNLFKDLTIQMCDGQTATLTLRLTPDEACDIGYMIEHYVDLAKRKGEIRVEGGETRVKSSGLIREAGKLRFEIAEDLTVLMSDGRTTCLMIRLTPTEAEKFAQDLLKYSASNAEKRRLGTVECAGEA